MTLKKTSLKLIIVLIIAMLAILALNIKSVYAVSEDDILNQIPDTIELDIKESDFEQVSDLLERKIKEIFEQNSIDMSFSVSYTPYITVENFHSAEISIASTYKKQIKIKFNNTDNFNNNDETYIKNLKLENPEIFQIPLNELPQEKEIWTWANQYVKNYYERIINNKTVQINVFIGAGAGDGLGFGTCEGGIYLRIFKNGILYDINHIGNVQFQPTITIPYTKDINEFNENVIKEIRKYFTNYANAIVSIEKGIIYDVETDGIKQLKKYNDKYNNIYTIEATDEQTSFVSIIQSKLPINVVDNKTNIKLDTTTDVVPSGTTLVAEKVSDGKAYNTAVTALGKDVSKFEMYDINLINNNAKIQPNGKVKVSIPVPDGYDISKIVVYKVADDGTKTKYDMTIKDGFIIFETDHFSNYIVAEQSTATENTKKDDTTNADENTTTTDTKSESTKTERKLDDTPKTGKETNVTSVISSIITVIATIGLAVIKKF